MSTWLPTRAEIAVMQAQHDNAAGLIESFEVPGGVKYERFVGNVGARCAASEPAVITAHDGFTPLDITITLLPGLAK